MKPRFTDTHRFAGGAYVTAAKTDVSKTIAREWKRLAEEAARQPTNVKPMKRKA